MPLRLIVSFICAECGQPIAGTLDLEGLHVRDTGGFVLAGTRPWPLCEPCELRVLGMAGRTVFAPGRPTREDVERAAEYSARAMSYRPKS